MSFLPSEVMRGCLKIYIGMVEKIKFHAYVATVYSYSFKASGLKFGMKIYLINAVKVVGQIFEFLSRS